MAGFLYIIYIDKGRVLYSGLKDELIEKYSLIKGGIEDLPQSKRRSIIGLREHIGGFEGMIEPSDIRGFPPGVITEPVSLDDIMVHISRKGAEI